MNAKNETIDAELLKAGDTERMVRQAMDSVFAEGKKPVAIVIYADYGDKAGCAVAGAPAHLAALAATGNDLLADMLRQSMAAGQMNG